MASEQMDKIQYSIDDEFQFKSYQGMQSYVKGAKIVVAKNHVHRANINLFVDYKKVKLNHSVYEMTFQMNDEPFEYDLKYFDSKSYRNLSDHVIGIVSIYLPRIV